jgi:predicted NUDIX family NTP pyrophosphohydrolase
MSASSPGAGSSGRGSSGGGASRPTAQSAGLLLYRRRGGGVEVLLAHPGGPFFRRRDGGVWTLPKGIIEADEDPQETARREFREEVGFRPEGELLSLGTIRQRGGKVVAGFATAGEFPPGFVPESTTFEMEWPRNSGHYERFPEVDRVDFFSPAVAREKINPAQVPFLDRLMHALDEEDH